MNLEKVIEEINSEYNYLFIGESILKICAFNDGWLILILKSFKEIDKLRIKLSLEKENVKNILFLHSAKEKFGDLRIWSMSHMTNEDLQTSKEIPGNNNFIFYNEGKKILDLMERFSLHFCESCGAFEGKSLLKSKKKTGWIKTICSFCAGEDFNEIEIGEF